jgi:L-threonylcarbamoyladenylate synthase
MPEIFKWPADRELPGEFLSRLKESADLGGLFVYPTNTLYGLGASIRSEEAVRALFELKSRPRDVPLPVMANAAQLKELCAVPDIFRPFLESCDTRITAILPSGNPAPAALVHRGTLAVRLPCSRLTSSLVGFLGPVTSTSANLHGLPTPGNADGLVAQFGDRVSFYIDSGTLAGQPPLL